MIISDNIETAITYDGNKYKANNLINRIYYCEDNIIIENFWKVTKDKERYMLIDYFLLDLKEKKITLYDLDIEDSFMDGIQDIEKIEVLNIEDGKEIKIIKTNKEEAKIIINKSNQIIGYVNNNLKIIGNSFLRYNRTLTELELPKVEIIGDDFLEYNCNLNKLELPEVKIIGDRCLDGNQTTLTELELPEVKIIGDQFVSYNESLTKVELPKAKRIGDQFLSSNESLTKLELPNLEIIGDGYLLFNQNLNSKYEKVYFKRYNEKK